MTFIDFVCLGVPLGLVSGGLVFFDRRKRNLGGACSRVPAEDSDGERAHYKENQAGRGRAGGVHEGHCDDGDSLRGAQDSAHEEEEFLTLCAHALEEVPGFVSQRRRNHASTAAWTLRSASVTRILTTPGLL